jgi:FMN-dependent NADH-azoreductase
VQNNNNVSQVKTITIGDKIMTQTILTINASSNPLGSTTRKLSQQLHELLAQHHDELNLIQHDVSTDLPLIDSAWIGAAYTPAAERSPEQNALLARSDELIKELKSADQIIIATPMYNFSVPAGLKAWIDLIARAGETFQYTAEGPQGLVDNKPVTLIISTGGVPVGSDMDFVSTYLKQVLGFIGLTDISVISADGMNISAQDSLQRATNQIHQLFQQRAIVA